MRGFVSPLILLLFLAVALGVAVVGFNSQTGFFNRAADYESWTGIVEKVQPCVGFQLCYKLNREEGEDYYLMSRRGFSFLRPNSIPLHDFSKYVGQKVTVKGILNDKGTYPYIWVTSIIGGNTDKMPANSCLKDSDCNGGYCRRVQCIKAPCYGICAYTPGSNLPNSEKWDKLRY